ncbi:MAG: hypothetical protein ABIL70_03845 [candidate division WOR-3 bacterium]
MQTAYTGNLGLDFKQKLGIIVHPLIQMRSTGCVPGIYCIGI